MNPNTLELILKMSIPLLFAITIHEYAHGFVADRLGDKTARMMGRLSLNPINHIDPFGTLLLPLALGLSSGGAMFFGYARPVPISTHNFKNFKRDMMLVTLAGPMSNFIMGYLWGLAMISASFITDPAVRQTVIDISIFGMKINAILGILNLLPIPPLDGSKIITILMPRLIRGYIFEYEQYGILLILVLAMTGILGAIIYPLFKVVMGMYLYGIGL
tara:strand:+ start:6091 stop:6741 length:651 start_codon:yes stop_codon:yes gene_type:complete